MSQTTILQLPAAIGVDGSEYTDIVQGGTTKKVQLGLISSFPTGSSQSANTLFAGPASGAAAGPSFRLMVIADLPGQPSATSGGIPYFSSTSAITSSSLLTQYGVVIGGGAGGAPSALSDVGTANKVLHGNASGAPTWSAVELSAGADVHGVLPAANGGTGITALGTGVATALGLAVTGSGGIALATGATLVAPNLGTPASGTLTNCTGLPASTGISGLGTGVATALGQAVTGSGGIALKTGAVLVTPTLGVALATSINGLGITTTTGTLTLTNGKTFAVQNSLTLAGTDSTTQTFPSTSGTVVTSVTSAGGDLTGTYPSPTIAANAVTNAKAAQMATYTLKGNVTGSTANAQDFTIQGLTAKASPASTDLLMIYDVGGTAIKQCTIAQATGSSVVASINATTGAFTTTYPISTTSTALTFVGQVTNGVFQYQSTTSCKFLPYNGDLIRIAGVVYQIPSAGIDSGNPNGGVHVNGTGSSSLTAGTLYYAYIYSNTGTLTMDFSTTAYAMDTTAGNIGTYIKSGDNTRTLVGMVRTVTGPVFANSTTQRFVRSWLNDVAVYTRAPVTTNRTTTSVTLAEINTELRNEFLLWSGETIEAVACGPVSNATSAGFIVTTLYLDGSTAGVTFQAQSQGGAGQVYSCSAVGKFLAAAEGYHYVTAFGTISNGGGTAQWLTTASNSIGTPFEVNCRIGK